MTASAALDLGCPSGLEPPAAGAPIDPAPFVRRDQGSAKLELAVFGAKCGGCIAKIEGAMNALPGMEEARLNLSTGRLTLQWRDGAFAPRATTEALDRIGYRAAPFDPQAMERESDADGRTLLRALAVAGFATANIMLLSISVWSGGGEMGPATRTLMHAVSAFIAAPAALYAGRPFFASAWRALSKRRANMDVPISLGVLLALGMSLYELTHDGPETYFDAAVMLLFFLLIGRYLDHRLRLRARAAARDLMALQATTATRLDDGNAVAVAARDIRPGDRLLLAPGDRAPVDCVIEEGASSVDNSLVTGESAPSDARPGATLHAGVLNLTAQLVVRAQKTADASLIADLTRLIEAGEQAKSRYVRLADRAAALYVPVVHTLALSAFAGWYFIGDAGLRASIMIAIAVLIITCPCALGLAAPAVQVVATGRLFRSGVLVKSGDALERLAETQAIIFDKTGTLTRGKPKLVNRSEIGDADFAVAAALARASRHPLARAIVSAAGPGAPESNMTEIAGDGVEGLVDGACARLGNAGFVGRDAPTADDALQETWLRIGEAAPVRFMFEDALRDDAREAIAALKSMGLGVEILSGDRPAAAALVASTVGVPYRASVSPQQKIARIEELREAGVKVAMVGDGLNDAPSLSGAHASLSPGAAADASQAAADFVYQGERLAPVVEAIRVARAARRRMLENFAFAALYNALAVPIAVAGLVTPLIAALAMSGSSVIVTLNALRLAKGSEQR
jgi:Cu2+-exporting ATPase